MTWNGNDQELHSASMGAGAGADDEPPVVPCHRKSAAWWGRCRTKIGVTCRLWVLVNCTRISNIKAESGDNPSFQLCSHREHLPRMTMFSNHCMQGKSDAEKICCKRRINAPNELGAVRGDFDVTWFPWLALVMGRVIAHCWQSQLNQNRVNHYRNTY
jgi:hypothetical protein